MGREEGPATEGRTDALLDQSIFAGMLLDQSIFAGMLLDQSIFACGCLIAHASNETG